MPYPIPLMEQRQAWSEHFESGWLAYLRRHGHYDFDLYQSVRNEQAPGTTGVELAKSRLLFISSAGGYLAGEQEPFDAPNPEGDYSLRELPVATPYQAIAHAHDHYDTEPIGRDPEMALPLRLLEQLVEEGRIGELAPELVSFMGYQPVATRVVDELVPEVVAIAKRQEVQAALLAPV